MKNLVGSRACGLLKKEKDDEDGNEKENEKGTENA